MDEAEKVRLSGGSSDAAIGSTAESSAPASATEPVNQADHSRRPIPKDVGRNKRVAENQTRGTKTSRKKKPNPAAQGEEPVQSVKKKVKDKQVKKPDATGMAIDA